MTSKESVIQQSSRIIRQHATDLASDHVIRVTGNVDEDKIDLLRQQILERALGRDDE